MRKKLHTLLVLSLLSAATLAVSCNKDKEDPDFNEGRGGGSATTSTVGKTPPNKDTAKYYYNEESGTLFKRAGSNWIASGSLVGYTSGNTVYSDKGAPNPSLGKDKDFYVNEQNDVIYRKSGSEWRVVEDEIAILDPNFKAALLSTANNGGTVDANGDGKISSQEALAIQSIRVSNANISSLSGIEHFKNLQVLEANNNKLKTVYFGKLEKLEQIHLLGNQLEGDLDFKDLIGLRNTSARVEIFQRDTHNTGVNTVTVADNGVARKLNNSEHTNKYTATGEVDKVIELDPVLLSVLGNADTNQDGSITVSEAEAYTGQPSGIDVVSPDIKSLEGLKYFKNVVRIRIYAGAGQRMTLDKTELNLTDLVGVKTISITGTNLTKLEVKNLPELTSLTVNDGNIGDVSILQTPKLENLVLERNNLKTLSRTFFDNLSGLAKLNLMGNQLEGDLYLSAIANLATKANDIQIMRACPTCTPADSRTNTGLLSIFVNTVEEKTELNSKEGTYVYQSLNSGGGDNSEVTMPDQALRNQVFNALKRADFGTYGRRDANQPFTQNDVDKITSLEIDNSVHDITGLERFTNLKTLLLNPQGPTTLDLTRMSNIEHIILMGTMQTITGEGTSLKKVEIKYNFNVAKLDLRGFPNLERVLITENAPDPNHIECIAVPANKVDIIKAGIAFTGGAGNEDLAATKQARYRDAVKSTPCN